MLLLNKDKICKPLPGTDGTQEEYICKVGVYLFQAYHLGSRSRHCIEFNQGNVTHFWEDIKNFIFCSYTYCFEHLYNKKDIKQYFFDTQEEVAEQLPQILTDEYYFILDIEGNYGFEKLFRVSVLPASKIKNSSVINKQLRLLVLSELEK